MPQQNLDTLMGQLLTCIPEAGINLNGAELSKNWVSLIYHCIDKIRKQSSLDKDLWELTILANIPAEKFPNLIYCTLYALHKSEEHALLISANKIFTNLLLRVYISQMPMPLTDLDMLKLKPLLEIICKDCSEKKFGGNTPLEVTRTIKIFLNDTIGLSVNDDHIKALQLGDAISAHASRRNVIESLLPVTTMLTLQAGFLKSDLEEYRDALMNKSVKEASAVGSKDAFFKEAAPSSSTAIRNDLPLVNALLKMLNSKEADKEANKQAFMNLYSSIAYPDPKSVDPKKPTMISDYLNNMIREQYFTLESPPPIPPRPTSFKK